MSIDLEAGYDSGRGLGSRKTAPSRHLITMPQRRDCSMDWPASLGGMVLPNPRPGFDDPQFVA